MMSLLLYTDRGSIGALNMYGLGSDCYDSDDLAIAQALAAHLAVAFASGREIEQRGRAMISRTLIGQAEGILMERFTIDAARAFDVLRRVSQQTNRKLVAVAEDLVSSGDLPQLHQQARGTNDPRRSADKPVVGPTRPPEVCTVGSTTFTRPVSTVDT